MKTERLSWVPILIGLVFLALLANGVAAVARYQVDALFSDQWSFYTPLFAEAGWWSMFTWQHGPHRQGVAFVLTALVMEASAWDVRVESLWVMSCLAVATGLAVWLRQRLAGRIQLSDTWIVIAGLSLLQYETVLLVPNASHSVFPLLLLIVAAHLMVGGASPQRLVAIGVIGMLAMFTGFGLFVAMGLWGYLGWQTVTAGQARLSAGVGLAVMVVGGALFARGYVFSPASEGFNFPPESWVAAGKFAGLMVASRMGFDATGWGVALAGGLVGLLILAVAGMAISRRAKGDRDAPLIGGLVLGIGVGFIVFTTLGRVHLGEVGALASRYTTLVVLLWWGLDLMMIGATAPKLRRAVQWLGWGMAVGPLLTMVGRPLGEGWGTAGLRDGDLVNLKAFEHRKLTWIAELQESGDWRVAESRAPGGVFPFVGSIDLDARLNELKEHGRSFYHEGTSKLGWLPWAPASDVIWWRPRTGGMSRNTPEGSRWFVMAKPAGYVNVALTPKEEGVVTLGWGGRQSELGNSMGMLRGISVPVSSEETTLQLDGIKRAQMPRWSPEPEYPIWIWINGAWRQQRALLIESGFHGWEEGGAYGWTTERLQARVAAQVPSFINIVIESRFEPVADGDVRIRLGSREATVPWVDGRAEISVPLPAAPAGQTLELINLPGAKTPAELGMWDDSRPLALRLARISIDEAADYPELEVN